MKRFQTLCIGLTLCASAFAQQMRQGVLTVSTDAEGIAIQPTMYGVFFEDINYAADGGLYAELVKNRSFEFDNPLMGWRSFGKVEIRDDGPFERCPHYLRLRYAGHPVMLTGVENEGYFGMGIKEGEQYRFSVWARTAPYVKKSKAAAKEWITFHICDNDTKLESQLMYSEAVEVIGSEWKQYEVTFTAPCTVPDATLRIYLETWSEDPEVEYRKDCCVDIEHVSLFPLDTWNGDKNGLRKDIAQAIADLKPGILRFPGGCIVEGTTLDQRYQWKNSVGPVENRPVNMNRWNYNFPERQFSDYYQSYGLGFYEFFRFAEEIGAEPLPVISCGMACQFQNDPNDHPHADPNLKALQPYIDDALDLIEFANGPADSRWGKVRADMGHPEPFGMKYLAVGNEQWGDDFVERLELFSSAIRARYPEIKLVGSSGPYLGGEWFEDLWKGMRHLEVDLVDEHYYSSERFFEQNAGRYDDYPRTGPKVFAGEYACHGSDGKKYNHFNAALLEAAFMTGLERNADVVHMSCYAPLMAHDKGWQWRPDLIWFDSNRLMKSCSYYVQQLYSTNRGDRAIPVLLAGQAVKGQNGLYATAATDDAANEIIIKVANLSQYSQVINLDFAGLAGGGILSATETFFHSDNAVAENTLDDPFQVVPVTTAIDMAPVEDPENEWLYGWRELKDGTPNYSATLHGRSFYVYRFKINK